MTIDQPTLQLTASLRRPGPRTLRLIEKAINLLTPYEQAPRAHTARSANPAKPTLRPSADTSTTALLHLLTTHRLALTPYLDTHRIESNLRLSSPTA